MNDINIQNKKRSHPFKNKKEPPLKKRKSNNFTINVFSKNSNQNQTTINAIKLVIDTIIGHCKTNDVEALKVILNQNLPVEFLNKIINLKLEHINNSSYSNKLESFNNNYLDLKYQTKIDNCIIIIELNYPVYDSSYCFLSLIDAFFCLACANNSFDIVYFFMNTDKFSNKISLFGIINSIALTTQLNFYDLKSFLWTNFVELIYYDFKFSLLLRDFKVQTFT
ncbi:hypothetical protein GF322_00815 [Candidatus Dependentiae bacterium]|nr:hypothetical protein [Candidatus Dependentiae bacterium]